jgi:hypothetical protein
MIKHQRRADSQQNKTPSRFSYPKKKLTVAAAVNAQAHKTLSGKFRRRAMDRAAELVGIVPFDWFKTGDSFVMFFGVDTVESALAAQKQLIEAGYSASFWNSEEEMHMVGAALRQLDTAGHEIGPITDEDGNEIGFDWRTPPKTN